MKTTRRALAAALALLACAALPATAQAQAYPNKPIRFVIAFAAGGPADIIGRLAGQKMSELLGQPVVVENRGGAGGNVATQGVAKAPADGYTVLVTTSAFAVNVTLTPGAYDAERDLIPVGVVAKQPNLIFVNAASPAKTLNELLAQAKSGKMAFASPGSGTTPHLTAESLFNLSAKADMTAVHFRGAGPAITAVVGGEPVVGSGALATPLPHVKAGKLRALAVSSAQRVAALPDVPTLIESGYPGMTDETWIGLFLPAGTPAPIVQQLNEAMNKALAAPDLKERLATQAFEPVGGTPAQFGSYIKAEIAKWGKVVKEGNIKPD